MICLAGDGWGAIAALKSLQQYFDKLQVCTNDEGVIKLLRDNDETIPCIDNTLSDVVVCAGYKPIIPRKLLNKRKFVNIHYSLLPKYRGMHSVVWAVLNGESKFGLSIHLMDDYIDSGDIIKQFSFDAPKTDSTTIMELLNQLVEQNLGSSISDYLHGRTRVVEQNKELATWVPKRNLSDCLIDFNSSCACIERMFLALVKPYPLPCIKIDDRTFEVSKWKVVKRDYLCTNGRVVNIDNEGVWIKLSDGLLVLDELQENSLPTDPRELMKIGKRLHV